MEIEVETRTWDRDPNDAINRKLLPAQKHKIILDGEDLSIVKQAAYAVQEFFRKKKAELEWIDNSVKQGQANHAVRIERGEICPCGRDWDDCFTHKGKRGKT